MKIWSDNNKVLWNLTNIQWFLSFRRSFKHNFNISSMISEQIKFIKQFQSIVNELWVLRALIVRWNAPFLHKQCLVSKLLWTVGSSSLCDPQWRIVKSKWQHQGSTLPVIMKLPGMLMKSTLRTEQPTFKLALKSGELSGWKERPRSWSPSTPVAVVPSA